MSDAKERREKGMKVVFFGGTGDIGRRVIKEIYDLPEIELIIVAGRSREKYKRLLELIERNKDKDKERIMFTKVNLSRSRDLSSVIRGADLIANASGPFYKYEPKIVEAAIKMGVNYISVCDDDDAAEQVLDLKMDEAARKRGVSILTGAGWTPGLSNAFVCEGFSLLDQVEKVNIAWAASTDTSTGVAAAQHAMHAFSRMVPSFQDGRRQMVRAGSGREKVCFLEPIGKIDVYHVGHPEPVTIPRYFDVEEVTLKGGINEKLLTSLAVMSGKTLARLEFMKKPLAIFFLKTLPLWKRLGGSGANVCGIRVDIEGTFEDKTRHHLIYRAVGSMTTLTGVPMAVAIEEMLKGKITRTGVFPPEAPGALDRGVLFKALKKKGVKIEIPRHLDD